MIHIALLTYSKQSQLKDGEQLLRTYLIKRGYAVDETPWDNPKVEWSQYDVIIPRACWNYHENLPAFLVWLQRLEQQHLRVLNPINILRWNSNKTYLLDLQKRGVRIIPSRLLKNTSITEIQALALASNWTEIVLKPIVGASAYKILKIKTEDLQRHSYEVLCLLSTGEIILQPYFPEVATEGEYSLVFFGQTFSHAVLKHPKTGEFRIQPCYGGQENRVEVSKSLVQQAQNALAAVDTPLLYARVDGVVRDGQLHLMELELIEPVLFFTFDSQATERFTQQLELLLSS